MKASEWTALLVAIAGVVAALAAIPTSDYRAPVLIVASALVCLALLIAIAPRRQSAGRFKIVTPQSGQGISSRGIVVSGTVHDLGHDSLFVFEESLIGGLRVWLFGGEALIDGPNWSFDYESNTRRDERTRRTLSVVRANRNCKRRFRNLRADSNGQLIIYDPPPDGCEILGQVSIYLTAQP